MKDVTIESRVSLPLYCAQERELTLEAFAALFPVDTTESVVEVVCAGGIRAFGIHSGSLQTPMKIVMTFCDYLPQNGNRGCFVALEPSYISQLQRLFPNRFVRVAREYVKPYELIM